MSIMGVAPWAKMQKQTEDPLLQQLLAQSQVPLAVPAPQPDDFVTPATQDTQIMQAIQEAAPIAEQSQKTTIKQSYLSPEQQAQKKDTLSKLESLRNQGFQAEQEGIDQYGQSLQAYQSQPLQYDLTPLAALVDQWAGGGNLLSAAQAMKPQTPEARQKELMGMRKELQGMKAGLTKSQADILQKQLDAILEEEKTIASEIRADRRAASDLEKMERWKERDIERDIQEYEKRTRDRRNVLNNYGPIEESLGFKLDEYDPLTNTVNGKPVDAPGIKLPGLQKAYAMTPEGELFRTRFQSILNDTLRAYSGAAVTDSEAAKTLQRFAINPLSVRESSFLGALKDFKRLLKEQLNDTGAAFRPIVVETAEARRRSLSGPRSDQAPKNQSPSSELKSVQDKIKQLEKELGP